MPLAMASRPPGPRGTRQRRHALPNRSWRRCSSASNRTNSPLILRTKISEYQSNLGERTWSGGRNLKDQRQTYSICKSIGDPDSRRTLLDSETLIFFRVSWHLRHARHFGLRFHGNSPSRRTHQSKSDAKNAISGQNAKRHRAHRSTNQHRKVQPIRHCSPLLKLASAHSIHSLLA